MTTALAPEPPRPTPIRPAPAPVRTLDADAAGDHLDRLYRVALGLCGNRADAEDLVQETYVRVLAKPRHLRGGDDRGYLLGALRNTFISLRARDTRRRASQALRDDVEDVACRRTRDPQLPLLAREVYRAIGELPPRYRDALVAVDVAGLTYAEAAQSLDVPIGTIMSRLYRGRDAVAGAVGATA